MKPPADKDLGNPFGVIDTNLVTESVIISSSTVAVTLTVTQAESIIESADILTKDWELELAET